MNTNVDICFANWKALVFGFNGPSPRFFWFVSSYQVISPSDFRKDDLKLLIFRMMGMI